MEDNGLPSRTSILTAAARALGSREPDASVRNPDWAAERVIGPAETALIDAHPIGRALARDFQDAINDPDVFGFVWLMLVRTKYIDERMQQALANGATQVVLLGAGFDTRAHRFAQALRGVPVIEIDYATTQDYKRRRVEAALGGAPANVTYAPIDFTRERLDEVLYRAGFDAARQTYCICEGVSMYVPEAGMRETLRTVASISAPGSTLLLEYINRAGVDALMKSPTGMIKNAVEWGEPFVFGVPDGQDRDFFADAGLELGTALQIGGRESVQRYATRTDGVPYGAHLAKVFQERRADAVRAMSHAERQHASRTAATSNYWLAELHVVNGYTPDPRLSDAR